MLRGVNNMYRVIGSNPSANNVLKKRGKKTKLVTIGFGTRLMLDLVRPLAKTFIKSSLSFLFFFVE